MMKYQLIAYGNGHSYMLFRITGDGNAQGFSNGTWVVAVNVILLDANNMGLLETLEWLYSTENFALARAFAEDL